MTGTPEGMPPGMVAQYDQDRAAASAATTAAVRAALADDYSAASAAVRPLIDQPGAWFLFALRACKTLAGVLVAPIGPHDCDAQGCELGTPLVDWVITGQVDQARMAVSYLARNDEVLEARVLVTGWFVASLVQAVQAGALQIEAADGSWIVQPGSLS